MPLVKRLFERSPAFDRRSIGEADLYVNIKCMLPWMPSRTIGVITRRIVEIFCHARQMILSVKRKV